ncbi:hypothetical protein [Nocardiopsis algeriensis]|uniref:Uncharacterized protein n=1 Tax=Nocardiopsis algeriensis TaxID=1478215 RepID=A0A841IPH9_9ACTN|nr:hypothetical protein [Nocardiopsis algeriensis]MBB6118251.1 hypothetical protein [Nocardiopsis algeriensis]
MTEGTEQIPVPRGEEKAASRDGGELPRRRTRHGDTTELYDQLSELLRIRPRHLGETYQALREADRLLSALDEQLRAGARLPEPWRRPGP